MLLAVLTLAQIAAVETAAQEGQSWASDQYVSMTTGAALLEIPIEVPKGTGGFEPQLSLRYSSHGTDGPFGVGWSLRLGEISRTLRFGTPSYGATDQFELDGELLIHNAAENRYHTSTEQFWRIRRVGDGWEVTYTNGNKAWYGRTPDSRVVHTPSGAVARWLLSDLDDASGNRIRIEYSDQGDPGGRYPDQITYSYRASSGQPVGGLKRIRFFYEDRPDVILSFPGGVETLLSRRVHEIRSSYETASGQERPFRRLALRYGPTGHTTQRSRLRETQLYGSDCALTASLDTCTGKPPDTLAYADASDVVGPGESQWHPSATATVFPPSLPYLEGGTAGFNQGRDLGYRFADVDGDGLIDILRADKHPFGGGAAVHKVFLNVGGAWQESEAWSDRLAELTYESQRFIGSAGSLRLQAEPGQRIWFHRKPMWDDGIPADDFGAGVAQIVDLDGDDLPDLLVSIEFRAKNRFGDSIVRPVVAAFRNTGKATEGWVRDSALEAGMPSLTMAMGIDAGDPAVQNFKVTSVAGLRNGDRYFLVPTGGQLVELNGDGRPDLVFAAEPNMARALSIDHSMACGEPGASYGGRQHSAAFMPQLPQGAWLNTLQGWSPRPQFDPPLETMAVASGIPADTGARFVDLNGDGLTDLVKAPVDATSIRDVQCGFVPNPPFLGEAVFFNTGQGWCNESACPGAARFRLPPGVTFARTWDSLEPEYRFGTHQKFLIDNQLSFVDLNADGLVDLLRADGAVEGLDGGIDLGAGLRAWVQDPAAPSAAWVEDARFAVPEEFAATERQRTFNPKNLQLVVTRGVRFLDVDGDGAIDLLRSAQHLDSGAERTAMARQGFTDVVRQYQNGDGGVVTFRYRGADRGAAGSEDRLHFDHLAALAAQSGPEQHGIPRWSRVPVVQELVRRASADDRDWSSRYFFVGPRWCRQHRAGLGFRLVDALEPIVNEFNPPPARVRRALFEQRHGVVGLPTRREVIHRYFWVSGPHESLRWSRAAVREVLDGDGVPGSMAGVSVARPLSEVEQIHHADGPGSAVTTTYQYDSAYPMTFPLTQTVERATGTLRITRTPKPADASTWIRGLVASELHELLGASIVQRSESYGYDPMGRLTQVDRTIQAREPGAPGEGVARNSFIYDVYGNLIRKINPDLSYESFCYDGGAESFCPATETNSHAWLSAVRDELNGVSTVEADPGTGELTHLVRFNGDRVRVTLDRFGRPAQVFLQPVAAAEFLLETWIHTDGTGSAAGRPSVERIEEVGDGTAVRTAAYLDGFGRVERVVRDGDGGWVGRAIRREGEGRVWKETNELPCGDAVCSALAGDLVGYPQRVLRYDVLDRLVEVVEPDLSKVQAGFRREQRSQPAVSPGSSDVFDTMIVRDAEGNLTRRILDGDRPVWIEECHDTAQPAWVGDFMQGVQLHQTSCQGPQAGAAPTTFYTYDGTGEIAAIYDQVAVQTGNYISPSRRLRYVHDTLGELRRIEDPDGGTQTMTYDLSARTRTWTNPRGETAVYFYDVLDRLEEVHPPGYPQSGSPILLGYDPHTRLRSSLSHGSAYTIEHEYDALGRLARRVQHAGGRSMVMDYAYDLLGRSTRLHYPNNVQVRYEYAGAYLRRVCEPGAGGTCADASIRYVTDVEYDAVGRVARVHTPPGVLEHTYDPQTERLDRLWLQGSAATLLDLTYGYDLNGRVESIADASGASPSASTSFDYDPRGRLTRHDLHGTSKYFRYDTLGNLTGRDLPSPTAPANLSYRPDFPHRLDTVAAGVPSDGPRWYDAAGNVTRRGDQYVLYDWQLRVACIGTTPTGCETRNFTYAFDGERLLTTEGTTQVFEFADWMDFQPDSPSATKGTSEVRVRALGRTIAVRTRTGSQLRSATTDFLPLLPRPPPWALGMASAGLAALLLVLAARRGALAGLARRPLPASLSLVLAVALLLPPGRLQAGGGGSGPLLQWVFSDPLGSGVLVTNSNATALLRRHFEPFGRLAYETGSTGSWPRAQFAGQLDDGAGLYDFQARPYDPDVGQFLQIDPLVPDPFTPADLNPYGYVRNDPVNGVDPTGADPITGALIALGFLKLTEAGLALGTTGVVVGTLATVGTAVGIHHATSPESYEGQRDSAPPVGWLQVAEASLETVQGRSVATRTASRSGYCPGGYDCNAPEPLWQRIARDVIYDWKEPLGGSHVLELLSTIGPGRIIKIGRIGVKAGKTAARRAAEIHSVLQPRTQRSVTTAVTETREGVRVVTSSEGRLRPAQRRSLEPGEVAAAGQRGSHAEVSGVNAARDMGLTPTGVAPSRPACPGCVEALQKAGVPIVGP